MRRKRNTALNDAVAFLQCQIESVRDADLQRLPSLKVLREKGGFSTTTLSRAIAHLAKSGALMVVPRGGLFLPPQAGSLGTTSSAVTAASTPRWQTLKQQLSDELLKGVYPPDTLLPGYKEFCRRYHTSYETARTTLESLVADGRLRPHGRGFKTADFRPRSRRSTIILVHRLRDLGLLSQYNSRSGDFWRALEFECERMDVEFEIISEVEALRRQPSDPLGGGPILGYIVLTFGYPSQDGEALSRLIRHLSKDNLPLSILDEDGKLELEPIAAQFKKQPRIRFFTLGVNPVSGRMMGTYLLGLGHQNVAILSLAHSERWCENRSVGLEQAYASAGLPHGTQRYPIPGATTLAEFNQQAHRWPPNVELHKHLTDYHQAVGVETTEGINNIYRLPIKFYLWLHYVRSQLHPLLTTLLHEGRHTAWVAASDNLALLALSFLREQQVRVPEEITVVGFDDRDAAFGFGLTSYNFSIPATIVALLRHLVNPPTRPHQDNMGVTEICGRVVARSSSGPAPSEE